MSLVFATLVLERGGKVYPFPAEHRTVTIGRSESSSICLQNDYVSSLHAKVVFDDATGQVRVLLSARRA